MSKVKGAGKEKTVKDASIAKVIEFLTDDDIRYHIFDDNAVELFMQARNLTMRLLIYQYNSHLIFRVPGFIRNVNLNRFDVLMLIMKFMNEFLDIRFEISEDGQALSASCQHILEDSELTRKQFDFLMMVILQVVDDSYPQFMQLLYAQAHQNGVAQSEFDVNDESQSDAIEEDEHTEEEEEEDDDDDDDIKIN